VSKFKEEILFSFRFLFCNLDDDSLLVKLVNEMESKSHLERGEYLNNVRSFRI